MDLLELLQRPEGKTLEFKRDLSSPEGVLRSLVAFANTAGGVLLVGVEDKTRHVRGVRIRSSGKSAWPTSSAMPFCRTCGPRTGNLAVAPYPCSGCTSLSEPQPAALSEACRPGKRRLCARRIHQPTRRSGDDRGAA